MIGGIKEIAGGALKGMAGQMGGAGKSEGAEKAGGSEKKSKEQQIMEQAQKLAQETDKGTLQEALSDKDSGAGKTGEAGKGNQKASSIASSYGKEVIEKAIEIKEQQEAQQQSQQMGAQQQDKTTLSPDAKAGGGAGGTIPQANALKGLGH
jgi:hypothetical protein